VKHQSLLCQSQSLLLWTVIAHARWDNAQKFPNLLSS
jgi:hypothetical protein